MCGLAGILTADGPEQSGLMAGLQAMTQALRHRGPDASGSWVSDSGEAALAHTRLSILDLSSAANQPLASGDGKNWIVFNGEIYNFRELRADLLQRGAVFRTDSDTEVLLQLYEAYGTGMLKLLRGMYAFAIWDGSMRRCFLARDPMGIKPLYYSVCGGRLAFASELQALQGAGLTRGGLDGGALLLYLQTGSVPEPHTLLLDCHCLEAGHYLVWQDGRFIKRRSDRLPASSESTQLSDKASITTIRNALLQSVEAHFVSDVPVGVFLSGGIDSTVLVALARHLGKDKLETFSVAVADDELNEGPVARKTAQHFDTQHHEMMLDAESGDKAFSKYLESMDQPSIDGFNTFLVSTAARSHGMKVVLSGLGGDELFAGYKSFDKVPSLARLGRLARWMPGLRHGVGWTIEKLASDSRMRRVGAFLRGPCDFVDAYQCFRATFAEADARRIAASYLQCSPEDLPHLPLPQITADDDREAVSHCEMAYYMRNQLLKDSDVMSMAHGLELRVPFVDSKLLEQLSKVPSSHRLRQGKAALLEAVPEVPEWVANQPKRGFVFPYEKWLKQHWSSRFAEASARAGLSQPTWYQNWAVFVLDAWLKRHGWA
jgi:asparagine synthase (glutamine-hydrolysing)